LIPEPAATGELLTSEPWAFRVAGGAGAPGRRAVKGAWFSRLSKRETLDPGEAGGPGADFRQEGQKDGTCGRNLQWRRMGLRAGLLRIDMGQASLETFKGARG